MKFYYFIKLVLKNVIKLAKGLVNNILHDLFNKILSRQLTHDRSYICAKKRSFAQQFTLKKKTFRKSNVFRSNEFTSHLHGNILSGAVVTCIFAR